MATPQSPAGLQVRLIEIFCLAKLSETIAEEEKEKYKEEVYLCYTNRLERLHYARLGNPFINKKKCKKKKKE